MSEQQPTKSPKKVRFAFKALAGFLCTPIALALLLQSNSSDPALLALGVLVLMLFFRSTRSFALGGLLFVGVAFIALIAVFGNSRSRF